MNKSEKVMVVPSEKLLSVGKFNGFNKNFNSYLQIIENTNKTKFVLRDDAENDTSFKQIIPYVIISNNNQIFSYMRGKRSKEKRLLGNSSIGIGGHINQADANLFSEIYSQAMWRELMEEVEINSSFSQKIVGVINDDTNDVGKVHFGVVHLLLVDSPTIKAKEQLINQGKFLEISELKSHYNEYENWSQMCIDNIEFILG